MSQGDDRVPPADGVLNEVEIATPFTVAQAARNQRRFLMGPIPIADIALASRQPGAALAVFLAIRHRRDLTGEDWVTLPKALLEELGVDKDAKSRSLRHLAAAGLVEIRQDAGNAARARLIGCLIAASSCQGSSDRRALPNRRVSLRVPVGRIREAAVW